MQGGALAAGGARGPGELTGWLGRYSSFYENRSHSVVCNRNKQLKLLAKSAMDCRRIDACAPHLRKVAAFRKRNYLAVAKDGCQGF